MSSMNEELAQKFYKHYDDMGYDKLNIARTVGPDLGRMVDHLMEENKKLHSLQKQWKEYANEKIQDLNLLAEDYKKLEEADLQEENKTIKGEYFKENEFNGEFRPMNRNELIGYCEVLHQRIKKLQEENEKLIAGIDDAVEDHFADLKLRETTHKEWDTLEEENKKLQEENKKLNEMIPTGTVYSENVIVDYQQKVKLLEEEKSVVCKYLGGNYNQGSAVEEILKGYFSEDFIKENQGAWDNIGLFEEENKYEAVDWDYCYGFTTKDGEYRITIAGGGSHWTDYVINKDGCFIHNKDGEKKVKTFISCPEANYVRIVSIGEDYELEEGETDMYEMVKECYEEEIMNYVLESETETEEDSDEEEDLDCCESCGKKFDLAYTMNHCEPKLREKYDKYMGSPEDDGDMCPICMDSQEEVVVLYPNDTGFIEDPEHPGDKYSFGNNCKSKIGDNYTMKRILKNGSTKDCVAANAYCMFVKGGKLYYQGRDSSGPAQVRTIKNEKTTMEFPY